ncbi:sigma-70 family RNA polymerase sigma factor [Microbacterium sp.]|uniref:RNA polymerase sigma factor n=1 Tax=Microbacterium sp. TaxID=51671 RepID=UPI002629F621|nr:sigma-70 family RNA polymerase sigma factor [Microbacterium sp.]
MTQTTGDSAVRSTTDVERTVAAVWRIESGKIVATLTRMVGDFGFAEDLAQDALLDALKQWPVEGVPRNPAAWLTAVAKRKAIDGWRRQERLDDRIAVIAHDLDREQADAADADPWDPDSIDDDLLRLVFISCHPVLSREARVALTLRVVAGLSSEQIARALLVPVATVQQRIVRAKKTLAAANVAFEVPPREEHPARLGAVLGVLYLIFNEGHAASSGTDWMRTELGVEAIRLARVLVGLVPKERDAHSLLALMELTAARFLARTDARGKPVLLADQDRSRWDRGRISRGRAALAAADALGGRTAYGLQAAIAECHAVAASVDDTDWEHIVVLYEALGRVAPSPIVELNRAAAVAMATGPASALRIIDELAASGALRDYHLLPATRGEMLSRLGRDEEARSAFAAAAKLAGNDAERALLEAKASGQPV